VKPLPVWFVCLFHNNLLNNAVIYIRFCPQERRINRIENSVEVQMGSNRTSQQVALGVCIVREVFRRISSRNPSLTRQCSIVVVVAAVEVVVVVAVLVVAAAAVVVVVAVVGPIVVCMCVTDEGMIVLGRSGYNG